MCLAAAVSFAIIGSTKFKPQVGDNGSCSSDSVCAKGNNNKEEIYNSLESKYDFENSKILLQVQQQVILKIPRIILQV